jgi:hypothetical protein
LGGPRLEGQFLTSLAPGNEISYLDKKLGPGRAQAFPTLTKSPSPRGPGFWAKPAGQTSSPRIILLQKPPGPQKPGPAVLSPILQAQQEIYPWYKILYPAQKSAVRYPEANLCVGKKPISGPILSEQFTYGS